MYKKAILDLITFDVEDVITTSAGVDASGATIPNQPTYDLPDGEVPGGDFDED